MNPWPASPAFSTAPKITKTATTDTDTPVSCPHKPALGDGPACRGSSPAARPDGRTRRECAGRTARRPAPARRSAAAASRCPARHLDDARQTTNDAAIWRLPCNAPYWSSSARCDVASQMQTAMPPAPSAHPSERDISPPLMAKHDPRHGERHVQRPRDQVRHQPGKDQPEMETQWRRPPAQAKPALATAPPVHPFSLRRIGSAQRIRHRDALLVIILQRARVQLAGHCAR
jgi:hypothetical protein